jgi:C4-dicarboxylate transporter DctM subunit
MPQPEVIGAIGILLMLFLIGVGVHIFISLIGVGFIGCVVILGFTKSLSILTTTPFHTTASYSLIVMPLFILMGEFAFQGGLGTLAYSAASKWFGRVHGGLAMATTAAAAIFAAITGSSLASAATMGKVAIPEMTRLRYDIKLACGVVASSGALAALIPPSGMMILYVIFTGASLSKLMIAGIIPGVVSALVYMAMIYCRVRLNPKLGPCLEESISWKEKLIAIRWLMPVAVVVLTMLGGLYAGIFSPIEAGAVGALSVLLVVLARRTLSLEGLKRGLENAVRTSSMIIFIIIGAMIFSKFLALSRIPDAISALVESLTLPPMGVLVIILLIYIVLGTFIDVVAMLALTLPIFFPILDRFGFNDIWIGILVIKMVEIAVITPPIGMNVYVVKGVVGENVSIGQLFSGILPFFLMELVILAMLLCFPQISLWLPSMMFK